MTAEGSNAVIWAIGGGKGGVGKTMLAANIGVGLAKMGNEVIVADTDLGGANLHSYLGIRTPEMTIYDFFLRRVSGLDELLMETPVDGLRCLPGSNEIVGMANPRYFTKLKFMRHISHLEADYIILDVGAGTSYNTLDLFGMADVGAVITIPEKPAIESAYGFVKATLYRTLMNAFQGNMKVRALVGEARNPVNDLGIRSLQDMLDRLGEELPELLPEVDRLLDSLDIRLVLNFVQHPNEFVIGEKMTQLVRKYLNIDVEFSGTLPFSGRVRESLINQEALLMDEKVDETSEALMYIIRKLAAPEGGGGDGRAAGEILEVDDVEAVEETGEEEA